MSISEERLAEIEKSLIEDSFWYSGSTEVRELLAALSSERATRERAEAALREIRRYASQGKSQKNALPELESILSVIAETLALPVVEKTQ